MKLTKERALELHRQMWSDMQTIFGDNPNYIERLKFKDKWCYEHFPSEEIDANCFLCEYGRKYGEYCCHHCPIKWDNNYDDDHCGGRGVNYRTSPISEILALPVREDA